MSNTVKARKPWLKMGENAAERHQRLRRQHYYAELDRRHKAGKLTLPQLRSYLNWIRGI